MADALYDVVRQITQFSAIGLFVELHLFEFGGISRSFWKDKSTNVKKLEYINDILNLINWLYFYYMESFILLCSIQQQKDIFKKLQSYIWMITLKTDCDFITRIKRPIAGKSNVSAYNFLGFCKILFLRQMELRIF